MVNALGMPLRAYVQRKKYMLTTYTLSLIILVVIVIITIIVVVNTTSRMESIERGVGGNNSVFPFPSYPQRKRF